MSDKQLLGVDVTRLEIENRLVYDELSSQTEFIETYTVGLENNDVDFAYAFIGYHPGCQAERILIEFSLPYQILLLDPNLGSREDQVCRIMMAIDELNDLSPNVAIIYPKEGSGAEIGAMVRQRYNNELES